jgi:hypothetical protein
LIEAFVLGVWPFLAFAVAAVMVLRRPWVPLVFFGGVLVIVISALVQHPMTTLAGIGLTLLGVPVYLLSRRRLTEELHEIDRGWRHDYLCRVGYESCCQRSGTRCSRSRDRAFGQSQLPGLMRA